jgi:hypothetical protein
MQRLSKACAYGETLLGGVSARPMHAGGDPLHLIFTVELHFLELDFFQEVFRVEVGIRGKFLEFGFVLGMLLGQTLILGVCIEEYVPRVPRHSGHAFLLTTTLILDNYSMSGR